MASASLWCCCNVLVHRVCYKCGSAIRDRALGLTTFIMAVPSDIDRGRYTARKAGHSCLERGSTVSTTSHNTQPDLTNPLFGFAFYIQLSVRLRFPKAKRCAYLVRRNFACHSPILIVRPQGGISQDGIPLVLGRHQGRVN